MGGNYTQDFDGLASAGTVTLAGRGPHSINGTLNGIPAAPGPVTNSGLEDWTMSNHAGSSTNSEFRAQDGSLAGSEGRGVVSFGTSGSNERALGLLATSNQISRFGVPFLNDSGVTLNKFSLSFTGEQWRRGDADTVNEVTFAYSLSATDINTGTFSDVAALSFTNPNVAADPNNTALDGNAPGNKVALSGMVSGLSWSPGETLWLRWTGTEVGGQDNGLAIDDLTFSAVPEPASLLIAAAAALAALLIRRR
jgi:hypothetical protein